LLVVGAVDWCGTYWQTPKAQFNPNKGYAGGSYIPDPPETGRGWIDAFNASDGRLRRRVRTNSPAVGGILATASGLIFAGDIKGTLLAINDQTGSILWHRDVGPVTGGIVTYKVNHEQFVAVVTGSTLRATFVAAARPELLVFSL
jgi:outer membrane protein assembly factor BamB